MADVNDVCNAIEETARCRRLLRAVVWLAAGIVMAGVVTGGIGVRAQCAAGEAREMAGQAKAEAARATERSEDQYRALRQELRTVIELLRGQR